MLTSLTETIHHTGAPYRDAGRLIVTLIAIVIGYSWCDPLLAHERWILTPDQITEWNAKPMPELYTSISAFNVSLISAFLLFTIGWIRLGYTGGPRAFSRPASTTRLVW
ncbi:hypothetical protein [Methyloglobulus sp.]|uniref:hypothetical protein n=1 Tax=Methyloglobulus sp. TaxID=2518622 RepID=UPI00398A1EE5